MTLPLADAAGVLRNAGLNVIELPGWQTRGESDGPFHPFGLLLHHDGEGFGYDTDPNNDMNVPQYMSQNGVNGAQFWVRRDGTWVCLAAGRKWHAGLGQGYGDVPANTGNSDMAGVETDHTVGNPWEKQQFDSIYIGCRALVQHYGWSTRNCCGHKEYAPDRKIDPDNFDLDAWRAYIGSQGSSAGQTVHPAIPPAPTGPVAAEGPLQPPTAPIPPEDIVTPEQIQTIINGVVAALGTVPGQATAGVSPTPGVPLGNAIHDLYTELVNQRGVRQTAQAGLNSIAGKVDGLTAAVAKIPTAVEPLEPIVGTPGTVDPAAVLDAIKAQWAK